MEAEKKDMLKTVFIYNENGHFGYIKGISAICAQGRTKQEVIGKLKSGLINMFDMNNKDLTNTNK